MRAAFWTGLVTFVSLLGFLSCGSGGGDGDDPPAGPDSPIVTGVNPAANASSVLLGNNIAITFDKKMNAGSASTFVVYGNRTGNRAGLYTGDKSTTLVFNPDNAFAIGDTVDLQTGATGLAAGDWDGNTSLDLAVANKSISNVRTLDN